MDLDGVPLKYFVLLLGLLIFALYVLIIFAIPRVIMSTILGKLVKNSGFNKMLRIERSTHESRVVVLPSPDFLYSVIGVDLPGPFDALRIRAPSCEYASLGIYDRNAKCTDIASHAEARLDALIVAAGSPLSNAEILSALKRIEGKSVKRAPPQIFRMVSVTGLLLHRILIPDPANYEEYKLMQSLVVCERVCLRRDGPCEDAPRSAWFRPTVATVLLASLWAVGRSDLGWRFSGGAAARAALLLLGCALCSGLLAYCTVKLLKNPKYAGKLNLTKSKTIKSWSFHMLRGKVDMRGVKCFLNIHRYLLVDLVTFLHGALGLLPSEVIYGTAITDADGLLLEYGATYVITVPTLYLLCQWWSVTLYAHDLYLIPNDQSIYSVNSMQLEQIYKMMRDDNGESYKKPLRILCSPDPPSSDPDADTYGDFWIPLPHRAGPAVAQQEDAAPGDPPTARGPRFSARASAKAPRLVVRVYRPVSSDWVNEFQNSLCPTITRVYPKGSTRKSARIAKRNFSISSEALVNAI